MESDFTIKMNLNQIMSNSKRQSVTRRRERRMSESHKASLIRIVLFSLSISSIISPVCSIYVECDIINAAKKCDCSKSEDSVIECPQMMSSADDSGGVYPVTLKVPSEQRSGDVNLIVKCNPNLSDFKWNLIGGVDLSPSRIGATITKLIVELCPIVDDGFEGFLNRVNISGDQLRKLTFQSKIRNISVIPPNFFNQMKNLEVVILNYNKLREVPDFSTLLNLKDINLKDNQLKAIPPGVFSKNEKLENLAFANNLLTQIELGVVPESVKSLDLSKNRILSLPKTFLEQLKKLQTLQLDLNPLTDLSKDAFDDLPELRILYLNFVRMKTFPSLRNLPGLTNLSMNYLRETPPSNETLILENLPSLGTFEAIGSNLQSLPRLMNVPNLIRVNLKSNKIASLSVDFFDQAKSLIFIDLSGNLLTDLVEIRSSRLERLDLSRNQITNLSNVTLRHLQRLEDLNLSKNKINYVDYSAFKSQGSLKFLDMSWNEIGFGESPFAKLQNPVFLGIVDLSTYSPLHPSTRLKKLILSHNQIDTIYGDWRMSKPSLSLLDLSYNKITNISFVDLEFVATYELQVNLTHNEISSVDLQSIYLPNERQFPMDVYLDGNPLNCDCSSYFIKSFHSTFNRLHYDALFCNRPERLKNLKLVDVPNRDLLCPVPPTTEGRNCPNTKCKCWKRPADETILADCSNQGLTNGDLEDFKWNLEQKFNRWKTELNLSGNLISDFKSDVLSNIPNGTHRVDLKRNKLTSITFITSLKDNTTVALANNAFSCDQCSDFVLLWAAYSSRIEDTANLTCLKKSLNELEEEEEGGGVEEVQLTQITSLVDDCKPVLGGEIRTLIIIVAVLAVFCVLLLLLMFRYAWVIKAYLYAKGFGWCLFWDKDADGEDGEKLYDAFVSYSHKDEEWVIEELVNKLEDKEGYKLCLHFRDWTPGDWIPDQIVKSVDQSKRTVVILSKNFVESVWSRLEFKAAHAQALSERSNRVILVLLEDDLDEKDVKDEDLRVYMKMNTYLKWKDPWFWHKLKYALPHRKNNDENKDMLRNLEQRERAIQLDKLRAKLEKTI